MTHLDLASLSFESVQILISSRVPVCACASLAQALAGLGGAGALIAHYPAGLWDDWKVQISV